MTVSHIIGDPYLGTLGPYDMKEGAPSPLSYENRDLKSGTPSFIGSQHHLKVLGPRVRFTLINDNWGIFIPSIFSESLQLVPCHFGSGKLFHG